MPARRWIVVPIPHAGGLAPILVAIAILAGLGLAAFALALAPGNGGTPAPLATIPSSVRPATSPPAVPADTLAPLRRAPAHAGRWM